MNDDEHLFNTNEPPEDERDDRVESEKDPEGSGDANEPEDEHLDNLMDHFFGAPGGVVLEIETSPEDASQDPDGEALRKTGEDVENAGQAARSAEPKPDDDPRTPEDMMLGSREIEAEAAAAIEELPEELEQSNASYREEFSRAKAHGIAAAQNALAAARHGLNSAAMAFHVWSLRGCTIAHKAHRMVEDWAKEHPATLTALAIVAAAI